MTENSEDKIESNASGSISRCTYLNNKAKAYVARIENLKAKFTSDFLSELSEVELKLHLEVIDKLHSSYEAVREELEQQDHTLMVSQQEESFVAEVIHLKALLMCQHSKLEIGSPNTPAHASTFRVPRNENSQSVVVIAPPSRLPELHLPTFNGSYTEWTNFFSMFSTLIDQQAELKNIEKFQHLRSCLSGVALDTIRSLEITDTNYTIAINLLKRRFDNKRLTFQAHIREILSIRQLETASSDGLRKLCDTVNSNLRALQTMASREVIADCLITYIVSQKLDDRTKAKWEEKSANDVSKSWDLLSEFLENRCQTLDNVSFTISSSKEPSQQVNKAKGHPNKQTKNALIAARTSVIPCSFCNSANHTIYACSLFLNLNPFERLKEAKQLGLCINCLKKGHRLTTCKSSRCRHCQENHHSLLHLNNECKDANLSIKPNNAVSHPTQHTASSTPCSTQSALLSHSSDGVLLATAIIYIKSKQGDLMPCRALLDSGSQSHFITSRLASLLQLKKSKSFVAISGIGENHLETEGYEVNISLQSQNAKYNTNITALVAKTITDNQPSYEICHSSWNIPENITLADSSFASPGRIDMLLGASLFFELLCVGQIQLGPGLPILQKTRLGWIVSGDLHKQKKLTALITCFKPRNFIDAQLDASVRKFWEIESLPDASEVIPPDNIKCENLFVQEHTRLPTGEYSVRLPMKLDAKYLGNSYQLALRRFFICSWFPFRK